MLLEHFEKMMWFQPFQKNLGCQRFPIRSGIFTN
jgi:hypothetical protein